MGNSRANMKWLERGGQGATIGATVGSAVPVVGTAVGAVVGGGIGAIEGLFEGWYDRNKQGEQNRWQNNELLRKFAALEKAGALETSAEQDAINRQLGIESQNLASTFAVSGGIRTGNYQRKVGELNRYATEDVARIARQKALEVESMKAGYQANVQQFNLELAKLESAKAAGDAQMAEVAGANLAAPIYDFISKLGDKGGEMPVVSGETFGPELPASPPKTMDNLTPSDYGINNPASGVNSTFDWIRNLGKPKTATADSFQLLWGS